MKKKILMVEDEVLLAMAKRQELARYNYETSHVTTGEKAVDLICQGNEPIDLILMDIDLGRGIDGTEAARQILDYKEIPIVFLSSHEEPEIVEKTEKITSYGYVVKSSSITVLDASIKMAFKLYDTKMNLTIHQKILEQNEQDLKTSQHIARLGSWRLDVATNKVTWTDELYKMYGFDPSLPPPPYTEHMKLFTPESWERLSAALEETVKTGKPYTLELEMSKESKSIGWMWVKGEAVQDEAGKTIELWGAAQDITEKKQIEETFRWNDELLNKTGELARVGGWAVDLTTNNVFWTQATKLLHEVPMDYEPMLEESLSFFPGESGERLTRAFNRAVQEGGGYDLELDFITAKGNNLKVRSIANTEYNNGRCERIYGTFQDITIQEEYNRHKSIVDARDKTLIQLHTRFGEKREELFDFIIEASKELTDSQFSFFGILNEDETEMSIHAWSKNTMESCRITDQPIHFPISESGIWGDCVRERKTVIYNDYSDNIATKHGTPDGHIPVTRYMGIPVFEGDRIVAVGGLANKTEPYELSEANALLTIYERLWDIVMRYRSEEALHDIEWLLSKSIEDTPIDDVYTQSYGDVTEHNTARTIIDGVGKNLLHSIAADSIDLLDTSVAVYEANGDYAFGMFSSGWCRIMDTSSRDLCRTPDNHEALHCGKWLCHENCWNQSAKQAMLTGKATDIECVGGIRLYAEPIFAGDKVIGSINIGYGNPPSDEKTLARLAEKFQLDIEALKKAVREYRTRPAYIIDIAKKRLKSSALLIGKLVESARYHHDLRDRVKELRCHHEIALLIEQHKRSEYIIAKLPCLLKKAMQYPEQTEVHIAYSGADYSTKNFTKSRYKISADIIVNNSIEGLIEIVYTGHWDDNRGSVFLDEEQVLIDDVAERMGRVIERKSISQDYTYLLEMINEAILFADNQGTIRTANQAAADLCGYASPEELIGIPMASLYTNPDSRDEMLTKIQRVGELRHFDITIIRKDGTTAQTSSNIRLIKDADGNTIGTLGAIRDVSELKQVQEELYVKEWAIESSLNALALASLDGNIIYVNQSFLTLWGYSNTDEVVNRSVSDFWDAGEDAGRVVQALQTEGKWKGEMTAKHSSNDIFTVSVSASMVTDRENKPICMFAAFEDITDLKRITENLKESEERFRILSTKIKDAVLLHPILENNEPGPFIIVNNAACDMFGYSYEEFKNISPWDLDPQTSAEYVPGVMKELIEKGNALFEAVQTAKDGSRILVEANANVIEFNGSKHILSVVRNISERKRLENSIKENEAKFRSIIDNSQDIIWSLSFPDYKPILISPAAERLFGYSVDAFIENPMLWMELTHPEDRHLDERALQNLIDKGESVRECRIIRPDGEIRYIIDQSKLVYDDTKRPVRIDGITRDVTELRVAQKELQENLCTLHNITDNMFDMVSLFTIEGEVLYISPSCERMLGYKPEFIIGRKMIEFVHPDDREYALTGNADFVKSQSPETHELRLRTISGEYIWVETIGKVQKDDAGEITDIIISTRDITERKKSQKALEESEKRFKILHNASFGGILIHDQGKIIDCNQGFSDLTGYSYDELIGMDGLQMITPEWREFAAEKIASGYEESYEARGIRKDGTIFPVRIHGKQIPYREKEIRVTEFRDISYFKEVQNNLEIALDQKQRLLRELNHRIKNSFNMIQSIIQLQSGDIQDDKDKALLRSIMQRVKTISNLYSLFDIREDSSYIDLSVYCHSIVDSLKSAYSEIIKKVSMKINCEPINLDMKNASTIGLCINEIITNSFKYAFPDENKGEIGVDIREIENTISITIRDNGIGLPEDFDIKHSSGLGTTLINGMIQQMNGDISVEGTDGTKYEISIPIPC